MPIYNGNIIFDTYKLRNTTTDNCDGYIIDLNLSGGTAPYKVSWSGDSSYSANTFVLSDLCEGKYIGTVTDKNGLTGSTTFTISATTKPTLGVTLIDDSCVLDTNKKGVIRVTGSTTASERFRYELRKDGILTDTHYTTTANTTHSFSSITNGSYSVTIVEETPTIDDIESTQGCTTLDYNSGDEYSGYTMSYLFSKWGVHIPHGPSEIRFLAGWGPGAVAEAISFDSGLRKDGTVASDNPYVWLYTGSTATRLTHSGTTWYLGTTGGTMTEGENVGPPGGKSVGLTDGDVGKFYYNSTINKFIIWWPSIGSGASSFRWVTIDPRVNYGQAGNPKATNATGTTYGFENVDVTPTDYTVDSNGKLALASSVVDGPLRKLKSPTGANNNNMTGRLSSCAYDNYVWETTVNSNGDDEAATLLLHSFRDTVGTYGPIGVTHTLSMQMLTKTGYISIFNNRENSAYAFNKYEIPTFRNCYSGCTGSTHVLTNGTTAYTDDVGVITILSNSGTTSPLPSGVDWSTFGGVRVRVTRNYNLFKIEFTDQLSGATGTYASDVIGDPKPYVSEYNIEFDLLDSTTWVGNAESAPEWTNNTSLMKYNSPGRIGIAHLSLPNTSFYHIKFKSNVEGHSKTELISATDKTTNNLISSKNCGLYRTSTTGIPFVRPKVSATMQVMPEPKTSLKGISTPKTMVRETVAYKSAVNIFNATDTDKKVIKFTFGGRNSDITLENAYPKYRIYPYIFETEEVSRLPDYEAMFGSLTNEIDENSRSSVINEDITIPLNQLSTETSWEFIIRPSFLYKDKKSDNDVWIDTAKYPPSKDIDYNNDYYMAVLTNPETPIITQDDFETPSVSPPSLKTERVKVIDMPDVTATTYSSSVFRYTLDSDSAQGRTAPLVSVNGVTLTDGAINTSDYKYIPSSRTIEFHPETVQNGDFIQVTYDALGGTYTQFLTVPETVGVDDTSEIFEKDDYYYINLEMQSLGAVGIAINGLSIYNGVDFHKTNEKQIMLMKGSDTYLSGDTIALFYRTIYSVISFTTTKEPVIPLTHKKRNRFVEDITVNLFDENGNVVQEQKESIGCDEVGDIERAYTLKPPTFGNFSYNIIVKRYYPLIDGEVVTTQSHSDRVKFEISRDVFYSPVPPNSYAQNK